MILHYFKKKENIEEKFAKDTYTNILKQSNSFLNNNSFFNHKDYNSSFEIVSIFMIFYIKLNIKFKINNYKLINEELIKIFILDLDESLREKGIGDMSIGKYVKKYVKKFYFRLSKFPKDIEDLDFNKFTSYLKYFEFIRNDQKINASKKIISIFGLISNSYKN